MTLYTKKQILDHWEMKTSMDNYYPYYSFEESIITMDSCFDRNKNLIPFSPLRRSSSDWKKVQVYPVPKNVESNKNIKDAYYINFFHSSHWGHFLTESLGRMHPIICGEVPTKNIIVRFETQKKLDWIINALEGKNYNIIPFTQNLKVEKLYLPVPTMVNFHYVLHEHIKTLRKYGSFFKSSLTNIPKKIYLSRSKLPKTHRVNYKEEIIENELKKYGWEIVHLQDYMIGDQIKILSESKVISGCMGSAFHNLMMCDNVPEKIIYLVPEIKYIFPNYAAHDELMNNNSIFINCQNLSDYNKRNFTFNDPINTAKIIEEFSCQK